MLSKHVGPSNGLTVAFPCSAKRVPVCCGHHGDKHKRRKFCGSVADSPLCPFKRKLDCARFGCNAIAPSIAGIGHNSQLSTRIAIAGINTHSKTRAIR